MNHTLTTTVNQGVFDFLNYESKKKNITKKSIIEKGIEYYKKNELEKQVKYGFESRGKEYKEINSVFTEIQFNSIKD